MSSCTTSSPTLVVIKHGAMMIMTTSSTKRTDALSTSVVVEDTGEGVGHGEEE